MANPRIDELRKRLEKEPGSRLFAQLAEELRKDGELEEAIVVCREGLARHANYPSARMTLGRALYDTGDLASAQGEFESVLKGAPDNLLASRLLGECLEGLGDLAGAQARYKATLALSPGDKQAQARLEEVGKKLGGGVAPAAPAASGPVVAKPASSADLSRSRPPSGPASSVSVVAAAVARMKAVVPPPTPAPEPPTIETSAEPPPIKLVEVDAPMELESSHEAATTRVVSEAPPPSVGAAPAVAAMPSPAAPEENEPPPIKLVDVDAPMELERPFEAGAVRGGTRETEARTLAFDEMPATLPIGMRAPGHAAVEAAAPAALPGGEQEVSFEAEPEPQQPEPEVEPEFEPEPPAAAETVEPARQPAVEQDVFFEAQPEPAEAAPAPVEFEIETSAPPAAFEPPPPAPVQPPSEPPVTFAPAPPAPEPPVTVQAAPPVIAPAPVVQPAAPPTASREAPTAAAPTARAVEEEIASVTLAELYFNQGVPDKAAAVLRQLLAREPGNERAKARLQELEEREERLRQEAEMVRAAVGPTADARAVRRQAIAATIARLEKLLAALRRG